MKYLILGIAGLLFFTTKLSAKQQEPNGSTTTYAVVENARQEKQDDSPFRAKTFTKSFMIDKNDKINLANQYGSITIKTWDKNEIKVDVDLKAYAKNENEAQKLLDEISISANKTGDLVSFKTEMGSRNGNWGSSVKNGKTLWRREVKIHYVVYMPMVNALTASQQYGDVIMSDFNGPTSIKIQYGNLVAGNLNNANNYISIQYGKGEIKDMGGAQIKHQYGNGLTIGIINNNLTLNAQYTAIKITAVKGISSIKHQYGGGTTIGIVSGAINVTTQYCPIKIGSLRGNFTSKAQYGKVLIDEIEPESDVDIDAQYSGVTLGFANNYNADLNIVTSYGKFNYGTNVTARTVGDDEKNYSSKKTYTGQIGKGGAKRVSINAQYGSVTFK